MPTMAIISRQEALARGLNRYFTGKPCRWDHLAERHTSNSDCVHCNVERNAGLRPIKKAPILPRPRRVISSNDILSVVSCRYGFSVPTILSHSRDTPVVFVRHIAIYLIRDLRMMSYPAIGKKMGRDHTSILHAVRKIGAMVERDSAFAQHMAALKHEILSLLSAESVAQPEQATV